LFQGAAENLSASAADPMRLVSPPSQADIEAKQALAGDLAKGVATPFIKGYEKFQQGDYAGAAGEALAFGSGFAVPAANPLLKAAIKGTKLNKIPGRIAEHGINPSLAVKKNFPAVAEKGFGQSAVEAGVATPKGFQRVSREAQAVKDAVLPQMQGGLSVPLNAQNIASRVDDAAGGVRARGADAIDSSIELMNQTHKYVDGGQRYYSHNVPQNFNTMMTWPEVDAQRMAVGKNTSFTRDRLGHTTSSDIPEMFNQQTYHANREALGDAAVAQGLPDIRKQLELQQQMLALENAWASGGRTNTWGERLLAIATATGGAGYGMASGSASNALPYLVAAGLISGTRNPTLMSALGIGLDRTGRAALSKPSLFGAGQLGSMGREEQ
jgi:hypothetical protein